MCSKLEKMLKTHDEKRQAKFWKSVNIGHIYPFLQCKLFMQYCGSFYGAPLMSLDDFNQLAVEWRKALRKVWRIPSRTHSSIVSLLSNCLPMKINFIHRFCKFYLNIIMSIWFDHDSVCLK